MLKICNKLGLSSAKLSSAQASYPLTSDCFIYIIGVINFLGFHLILCIFHMSYIIGIIILLGIRLSYIFGIITYLGLYFLTADNKETMIKMCNKLGLSSAKLSSAQASYPLTRLPTNLWLAYLGQLPTSQWLASIRCKCVMIDLQVY